MGRTVIFAHGPHSFHGHTVPIDTGGTTPRRSLATYYHTCRVGTRGWRGYHSTVFALDRGNHFVPSDIVPAGPGRTVRQRAGEATRMFTPPLLWNWWRHLKGQL